MPRDLLGADVARSNRAGGVRIRCLPMRPRDFIFYEGLRETARRALAISIMRRLSTRRKDV